MSTEPRQLPHKAPFYTTQWTRVCQAKADSDDGRKALADLCDAYYEPVLAYLRSVSRDTDAAREMGHAFFAEMLGGGTIITVDRQRGRFRSYLLGAVKHFALRQRESAQRMKRGGGAAMVPMDDPEVADVADTRNLSPDAVFDRQWAITVLARGMELLRVECFAEGRELFFSRVKPLLSGNVDFGQIARIAAEEGMTPDAFRMAVHRLKKRLRQCVKTEVSRTLDDAGSVQEEMQALFAALGR